MKPHPTPQSPPQKCAFAGCNREGLYKGPIRSGQGIDYDWFCLEHIRVRNREWNYLAGCSAQQIEAYIRQSTVWERPTWPFGKGPDINPFKKARAASAAPLDGAATAPPEVRRAWKIMGLVPPQSFRALKKRYYALAKIYHPDTPAGRASDPQKFRDVQRAFTTLRRYYAVGDKQKKNIQEAK